MTYLPPDVRNVNTVQDAAKRLRAARSPSAVAKATADLQLWIDYVRNARSPNRGPDAHSSWGC